MRAGGAWRGGTSRADSPSMRLACLVLLTGCGLSSGDQPSPDVFARDCIQTIDTGPTLPNGPIAIVLTSACSDASMIDNLQIYDNVLESVTSFTQAGAKYHRARIADLDNSGGVETLGLVDDTLSYVAWNGITEPRPTRVDYARPFEDLQVADLDRDHHADVVVAGDGAIRVTLGTGTLPSAVAATDEQVLLSGKPFRAVAIAPTGELYYLAQKHDEDPVEIGVAHATSMSPPTYAVTESTMDAGGPVRQLVLADVDGDGVLDAIGLTSHVFVRSSRTGTVSFLPEAALAIAAGDNDADGVREPLFLAADGASVRRVRIASDGSLTSEHVLDVHAQALAVGDFDANGIADIATVDRLGRATSAVSVYRF